MLLKYKRKLLKLKKYAAPAVVLFVGVVSIILIIKRAQGGWTYLKERGFNLQLVNALIKDNPLAVLPAHQGKTNFLFMGMAGGNHAGADLTDTMIFISIDARKKKAFMLPLPRDIWSPTLKDKINSAYHYGEKRKEGGGFTLAKSITEEVVGQPVHYALLIDFSGFKKIVDTMGGVDVEVPMTFIDKKFPIPGKETDECDGDPEYKCRYETVQFNKGKEHMDGSRALKYVRSRHTEGKQGTDFSRSKRQKQIIFALKDKLISSEMFLHPLRYKQLYEEFQQAIKSDLQFSHMLVLAKTAVSLDLKEVHSVNLDLGDKKNGEKGWLYHPSTNKSGRWLLLPRGGSFKVIHQLVACHIASFKCNMQPED